MSHRKPALVFAALAAFVACSDDDGPTGNSGTATIRVVNASPTNAAVSLADGSTTLASTVAFGTSGPCVDVPAGRHVFTFDAAGTPLASTLGVDLEGGQNYTVVLSGSGASTAATWFTDEYTAPTAGNTMLRILNATGTAGDVFVTTADAEIAGTPTIAGLAAGLVSPYTSTPNTSLRARLLNVGTTATARGDVTFTAPTSGAGTVVFTAAAAEGGPTGFLVEPCG